MTNKLDKKCFCEQRRSFLKKTSSYLIAFISLQLTNPFLLSCSKYADESSSEQNVLSEETGISFNSTSQQLSIPFSSSQGSTLQSDGGFVTIDRVDSTNIFVMIANIDNTLKAFSSLCPHANVHNQWSLSNGTFICGSHNSIFNSTGNFLNESSTNNVGNLTEYTITTSSNNYIVHLS